MSEIATIQPGPPQRGKGLGLRNAYSSVVAGVGGAFEGTQAIARPELKDITSDEAIKQFQEYNTNTNLRVNEKRMWGSTVEKVAGYLLTGAAMAIGGAAITAATAASIPLWVSSFVGISAMVGVTVGVFHVFNQPANREQSDKYMDVSDFGNKRNAALIAQEISKMLDEREAKAAPVHSHTREAVVMQEAANENTPQTQIMSGQRQLEERVSAPPAQPQLGGLMSS